MLTSAQLQTLAAHIRANTDPDIVAALPLRNDGTIADWYNADSSFVVWRTSLTHDQARSAIIGGDGLAQLDNLMAGKRDSLFWTLSGNTDPSNATQRAAIHNLCGTQNALKAAILAAQKRFATRAENVFTTGTGTSQTPGNLVFEGQVSVNEISTALNTY